MGSSAKPAYERPLIQRHQMGLMNKFGRGAAGMRAQTSIDSVPIATLVEKFGSPLFVFSQKTLTSRFRELHDAFAHRFPDGCLNLLDCFLTFTFFVRHAELPR